MSPYQNSTSTNSTQPAVSRIPFDPKRPLFIFHASLNFYVIVIVCCCIGNGVFLATRGGCYLDYNGHMRKKMIFLYLFITFWSMIGCFLISVFFSELPLNEEPGWWTAFASVFAEAVALFLIWTIVDIAVWYYQVCSAWLGAFLSRRFRVIWA